MSRPALPLELRLTPLPGALHATWENHDSNTGFCLHFEWDGRSTTTPPGSTSALLERMEPYEHVVSYGYVVDGKVPTTRRVVATPLAAIVKLTRYTRPHE